MEAKLKAGNKIRQAAIIKRQADQGWEGSLRGGRGRRPLASPHQKKWVKDEFNFI
jgi:hypothetical protein